jgi:signal peptidase I
VPSTGPSMRPTLEGPESLEVDYAAYDRARPALGDVVMLQGPVLGRRPCATTPTAGSPCSMPARRYGAEYLVKRIVGLPRDEIAIAPDGRTIRNGERQAEAYVRRCRLRDRCALPRSIAVPDEHYFVAGENRRNSTDSRDFGPVPLEALDGRVIR